MSQQPQQQEGKSKRSMKDYYVLITAGPTRDTSTHRPVPVNSEQALHFDTDDISCDVFVRVRNYRGPPSTSANLNAHGVENGKENLDDAKKMSPWFEHPLHEKDQYSISFSPLVFKGDEDVSGDDLVLGNDFDRSISQALPPGFGVAWRVARYLIDPGLEGDPWAEKPWLEGPVLSSVNALSYGDKHLPYQTTAASSSTAKAQEQLEKGIEGEKFNVVEESLGLDLNPTSNNNNDNNNNSEGNILDIPTTSSGDRMKYFLKKENREAFKFHRGKKYHMDFYNPYLDFNEFALKLPGVTIRILKYWDGQPLRYVLKNRKDQKVYMVVQFTLVERKERGDSESGGSYTDGAHIDEKIKLHGGEDGGEQKKAAVQETSPDDVD